MSPQQIQRAGNIVENVLYPGIPSEAKNLSSIYVQGEKKKERFLASLGMKERRSIPECMEPALRQLTPAAFRVTVTDWISDATADCHFDVLQ